MHTLQCCLVLCSVAQSCPTLCDPKDPVAHQAPLSMGFSRQDYWSGLPFPSPGNLPNPGIEPWSPTLQVDSLPSEPLGKPHLTLITSHKPHLQRPPHWGQSFNIWISWRQSTVVSKSGNHWCSVISEGPQILPASSTTEPLLLTEILAPESFC